MNLTVMETNALKSFNEGMDQPGCGWLHEMGFADENGKTVEGKRLSGVISSLVKKGVICTVIDEVETPDCVWVEVEPAFRK
jgi:hypothetical protein